MTTHNILKEFDHTTSNNIIEFGKNLTNTAADVYILMARKAACFIDCLEEANLVKLRGIITSERILDMNIEWLKNRNICIIDDTVISGTTLYKTINRLKEIPVSNITLSILSINKDWFPFNSKGEIDNFVRGEATLGGVRISKPFLMQDNAECIRQCNDIVKTISLSPRPYDVDFPFYVNIKLKDSKDDLQEITNLSGWESYNVSSSNQSRNDIVAMTLIPTEIQKKYILKNSPGSNLHQVALIKIRIYIKINRENNTAILRLVPLAILPALKTKELTLLFNTIISQFPEANQSIYNFFFSSNVSRFRFMQYLLAHKVGDEWQKQASQALKRDIDLTVNESSLGYIFPPEVCDLLEDIDTTSLQWPSVKIEESTLYQTPKGYKLESKFPNKVNYIQKKLTEPFTWLYRNKELPSRRKVKTKGLGICDDQAIDTLNRLNEGFSYRTLCDHIKDIDNIDHYLFTSIFLDKIIDIGIAVPVCIEKDDIVFRGFRHGEDVVFSREEERMCSLILESFLLKSKRDYISHFLIEKLFVLLLQIGTRERVLDTFINDPPFPETTRVASVKYYLHGPVVIKQFPGKKDLIGEPYLTSDNTSSWMVNTLLHSKVLRKNEGKYYLHKKPHITLSRKKENFAKSLGSMLGTLVSNDNSDIPRIDPYDDFVTLTTCLEIPHILSALSAEIVIFSDSFTNLANTYHHKYPGDIADTVKDIRHSKGFIALNSGRNKFKNFIKNTAESRINAIGNALEEIQDFEKAEKWYDLWPSSLPQFPGSLDDTHLDHLVALGLWICSANVYLLFLTYLMLDDCLNKNKKKKLTSKIKKELYGCSEIINLFEMNKLTSNIKPIADSLMENITNNKTPLKHTGNEIINKLQHLIHVKTTYLEKTTILYNNHGIPLDFNSTYSYALHIDIETDSDKESAWYDIERFIIENKQKIKKQCFETFIVAEIPDHLNKIQRGKWILCSGGKRNNFIVNFSATLIRNFFKKYHISCTIFSQLPSSFRITFESGINSQIYPAHFWDLVLQSKKLLNNSTNTSSIVTIQNNYQKLVTEWTKVKKSLSSGFELVDSGLLHKQNVFELNLKYERYNLTLESKNRKPLEGNIMRKKDDNFQVKISAGDNSNVNIIKNMNRSEIHQVSTNESNSHLHELQNSLNSLGISKKDQDELISILSKDRGVISDENFTPSTNKWIAKMVGLAANNSIKVSAAAAGGVLATAISKFVGLI